MSCQPTESFEFEFDIFVSAGIVNLITEHHIKMMQDLKVCRVQHCRELIYCFVEFVDYPVVEPTVTCRH